MTSQALFAATATVLEQPAVQESSPEDLAVLRYLLDLSLQPLEKFDGFTRIEQVGGSALRYQLNFIQYALAMAQFTRTPAFSGYLREAQANCIIKMCDRRVWRYWAWENLLGYQRWNPDPILYHNVMYSGFFGVMLGFYETLNDDRQFSSPGALTLHWNARTHYRYDFASLTQAIRTNLENSPFTLYACEPHLVYPMCNTFALNTLFMHDRLHDTDCTGDMVQRMRDSYHRHRFLREDGRFILGRSKKQVTFGATLGNDAVMAIWLHALMPQQSAASWELVRHKLTRFENGEVMFKPTLMNRLDFGNYSLNDAWTRSYLLCVGREMGDEVFADAVAADFERLYSVQRCNGARVFDKVSGWGNASYALARFTRPNALRDLVLGNVPDAWKQGPLLDQVAYPDVLVAKAVTDGEGLELVLYPGAGATHTRLALAQLKPGARYHSSGTLQEAFQADEAGRARVEVRLTGRTEVVVRPIG